MVMYKVFEEGIEVNGRTIYAIVNALLPIKFIVRKIFLDVGLPDLKDIGTNEWYLQQKWLDAFKLIADKAGPHTLMSIGEKIPDNALFPSKINDIEESLKSIDVAYHLNHRNSKGQILFENGEFIEGIGHYAFEKVADNKAIIVCNNPYNCDFDKGIITRMAKRFEKEALVVHDDQKGCRKLGSDSCTYYVVW